MGVRTDAAIAAFQEEVGIKLPNAKQRALLEELSQACFSTIRLIEHELSGIRDGDGYWHGSDPLHATLTDLIGLCEGLKDSYEPEYEYSPTPPHILEAIIKYAGLSDAVPQPQRPSLR